MARTARRQPGSLSGPVLGRPEAAADPALFAEALAAASLLTVFTDTPASLQLAEQADQVAWPLGHDRLLVLSRQPPRFMHDFTGEGERAPPLGADAVRAGPASRATTCCCARACSRMPTCPAPAGSWAAVRQASACLSVPATLLSISILHNSARRCPPRLRGHPGRQSSCGSRHTGRGGTRNFTPRDVGELGRRSRRPSTTSPAYHPPSRSRPHRPPDRREVRLRWPPSSGWRAWPPT